jgi:leucyl aminopeptidase
MPSITITTAAADRRACDLLVVGVYDGATLAPGAKAVGDALGDGLADLFAHGPLMSKPFDGGVGQVVHVSTLGTMPAKHILFVGLGPKAKADRSVARRIGATVARKAGGATDVTIDLLGAFKGKPDDVVAAFVEGLLLGSYAFERFKSERNGAPNRIETITLAAPPRSETRSIKAAVVRAESIARGVTLTRDLINLPASEQSPASLAEEAQRVAADGGFAVHVFDHDALVEGGFGGILGVSQGAAKPGRLVELSYEPRGAKTTVAIIGKGITFDSGGLNLKPGAGMTTMKTDMSGAAAVLGLFEALTSIKPKGVAVRGYLACAENMPDGNALRPGDVIRHRGGTTSEIGNTDAEGRLVMADALAYAKERGADIILDIATLTGAVVQALGREITAVLGTDATLVKRMLAAGERAGEPSWELPLWESYRKVIASQIADQNNAGSAEAGAGTITAGLFLKTFVGDTPWVHLDIAGTSRAGEPRFENPKGATGTGVRTLLEFIDATAAAR